MPALTNKTQNNSQLRTLLIASLIIGVAFVLRINYVSRTEVYLPIRADARNYCIYAQNLIPYN